MYVVKFLLRIFRCSSLVCSENSRIANIHFVCANVRARMCMCVCFIPNCCSSHHFDSLSLSLSLALHVFTYLKRIDDFIFNASTLTHKHMGVHYIYTRHAHTRTHSPHSNFKFNAKRIRRILHPYTQHTRIQRAQI